MRTGNEREVIVVPARKESGGEDLVHEAGRVVREAEREKEREGAIRR